MLPQFKPPLPPSPGGSFSAPPPLSGPAQRIPEGHDAFSWGKELGRQFALQRWQEALEAAGKGHGG